MVAVRQGRRDDALASLACVVELPGASDYAHYLYGRLLWDNSADVGDT